MKKHILTLSVLLLAFAATADVLLWQVTTEAAKRYKTSDDKYADYAVFYYADASGDGVKLDDAALFAPGYESGSAAMKEQAITILPSDAGLTGTSFWIELYATNGGDASKSNKVAWSMPIAYETLQQYMTGTLTALSPVYHPTVVPEPTGGLLFLLGLAGLALRRR